MGYFQVNMACAHYDTEWNNVVAQIKKWPAIYKPSRDFEQRLDGYQLFRNPPTQGIEAKALYIFTISRRLIRSAWQLAQANEHRWNLVFVETSSVLFPMIELVGEARRATGNHELGAGIRWLQAPENIPAKTDPITDTTQINTLAQYMNGKRAPKVCDLYHLRNYYLHGSRQTKAGVPIADIVNAELPLAIARQAETAMHAYWHQLRQDDGTKEWVSRLAAADIHPFVIQGSGLFEAGLVDPNIVDYLEDLGASVLQ